MSLDLEDVLEDAYASEINTGIASFWDDGWAARIGDELNGYKGELIRARTTNDLALVLAVEICTQCPGSVFAEKYKERIES
jgi:hypothetical protein